MSGSDLQRRLDQASRELDRLRAENERLRTLLALAQRTKTIPGPGTPAPALHSCSAPGSAGEKIALMRCLFRGRDDVYALRWESARTDKSGYAPATAEGWNRHGPKTYLPLDDEALERHLRGRESIGVYPLLHDDTCWFLACDLDGATWQLDALALLEACAEYGVPAALERSRSGAGGHVWIFFAAPVAATAARRLGALLLRAAMTLRGELDLASYDRIFPNQDFLPAKGFGNLIALPLQGRCRAAGTSVFLDPARFEPWPDQWAFLSSLERLASHAARASAERARGDRGRRGSALTAKDAAARRASAGRDSMHDRRRPRDCQSRPAPVAACRAETPGLAAQSALLRAAAASALHPPNATADPLLRGGPDPPPSSAWPPSPG